MEYEPDYEALIADQQVLIRTLWSTLETLLENWQSLDQAMVDRATEIVAGTKRHAVYIVVCECGHLMTDHDTNGCMYLGCKPICGNG